MLNSERLLDDISRRYPGAGPNKRQELSRLVFEIAKRDGLSPGEVLDNVPKTAKNFPAVKNCLLQKRFPKAVSCKENVNGPLPALKFDPSASVETAKPFEICPKHIVIENSVRDSALTKRLVRLFSSATISFIENYREAAADKRLEAFEFNRRTETFFVVKEHFDFFKKCPCTPGVVGCGYHNVNLGFGCPFECSYCFLQSYTNAPGIVFPANLDDFFESFENYQQDIRVGSGETADSLVYDHITEFSRPIVNFFRSRPRSIFEFKTKSANINGLLSLLSAENVVVGWSVNPSSVIRENEFFTASLSERLTAARECAKAGYRVAFHFDPIFDLPGWSDEYGQVVEEIFSAVESDKITWISLGTLRMTARQKIMIESRFPSNKILDAELFCAPDGKIRYSFFVRRTIYETMIRFIRERSKNVPVYLCMEPIEMWKSLELSKSFQGDK